MSSGPHVHDWHYNDAERQINASTGVVHHETIRYCKTCKLVEIIQLKDKEK